MASTTDLPAEVISAIQKGRKIEAIKLLREAKGLGLKESKHAVEDYIRKHPSLQPMQSSSNGLPFVAILVALGIVIYLILS